MRAYLAIAALIAGGHVAAQDSIQLLDARFVMDKKMTRNADGVTVHFDNGDIFISTDKIQSTTARLEGIDDDLTAEDRDKLAEGLVRDPNGRWVTERTAERRFTAMRRAREKMIEDAKTHRRWANRYEERTRNFEFEYTIDPAVMQEHKDLLEAYFKYFTKEWTIRKPRGMGRLKVCFYHDEDYFHQVSGARPGVAGYFRFVEPIELDFYFDRMDPEKTIAVMFHEANHYLTHLIDPKFHYPSWINESLAEYYGASEWDPVEKEMSVGNLQEGRLAVIQDAIGFNQTTGTGTVTVGQDDAKWQDLEELIGLPQGRFTSLHYAWGWSFVHFLFHGEGGKYEKNFKKFYKSLPSDRKIPKVRFQAGMVQVRPDAQIEALKRYLKVKDLDVLEREWHDYVRGLKGTGAAGKVLAGRIAFMEDMPIKAKRFFNEAIEAGSTNPLVYYYLGQAHYDKREYQDALDNFVKFAELDPLNGMVYVHMARCVDRMDKDNNKDEVKRLRQLALEVDPDNYSVFLEVGFEGK